MFDFLLLYEANDHDPASVTVQFPTGTIFQQLDLVGSLAIPDCIRDGSLDSAVFCFNTGPTIYEFAWSFRFGVKCASVVLVTSCFYPSLFFDFWHAVAEAFPRNSSAESDPICRFGFAKSLLQSWSRSQDGKSVSVNFPSESFSMDISNHENLVGRFNVAPLCPNVPDVWYHLLSNKPVLIIAPSPEIASSSAIAAMSLVAPIKYSDPFLLFTSPSDLRADEIAGAGYKLVASCDPNFDATPYSLVITINSSRFGHESHIQKQFQRRTERYFAILLAMMNYELLKNPYFDILGCPIIVDTIQLAKDADRDLLRRIQDTQTFKVWRKRQITRDQVRTAFVSSLPQQAVSFVEKGQCKMAGEALDMIEASFPGDLHLKAVLKAHRVMLKKKMRQ
jgi:hypothetical protein